MDKLFEEFLREKLFLINVSPRTIKYFRYCYAALKKRTDDRPLTKQILTEFVIGLRESGISPQTVNSYIRGLNSFLSWLYENGRVSERLRMKLLKEPQQVIKPFTDAHLKRLLAYRPHTFHQRRLYTLICLLIDTGLRIEEALTLTRERVDVDNLLVTVLGKGGKVRIVPISPECRKQLYRFLKAHNFSLVFPTRDGGRMSYRNSLREFKALCQEVGISGVRTSWHTLRHGFALNYVRQGGSLFHLQKVLGHSSLEMTKRYCDLTEDDLKVMHQKTSILGRLK